MNNDSWWSSLRHGGLLLSPQVVSEIAEVPALNERSADPLRAAVLRVEADDSTENRVALLDLVFVELCGFREGWQRGPQVEPAWGIKAVTGEVVKPRRLWLGANGAVLPVFYDDQPRLGIGRGRRSVSRVLEWCRASGRPLAVLTNARQFRLIHCSGEAHAWAEWDTSLWFEAGQPGPQVEALRRLFTPALWTPERDGASAPLADAVARSRQGQSQLTGILGERVRQAVEVILRAHAPVLRDRADLPMPDVYRAATLVVMRLVVALFAEARDLFPRSNRVYEGSYGIQGLWDKLTRSGQRARLRTRHGAWPQLLGLFRLIHDGSHHAELPMRRYGGELFRPGQAGSTDPVRRAMHLFETACFSAHPPVMNDADVLEVLERLTRCAQPVRQGRGLQWVTMPVDFANLSTEYIGILYEGLLDYELHQAPEDDAILFLNLGDQPALKLSALEGLTGSRLKDALKEFGKKKKLATGGDDEEEEEQAEGEEEAPDASGPSDLSDPSDLPPESASDALRQRVDAWLRSVVIEQDRRLATALRSADPGKRAAAEERLAREANGLLARPPVLPGDFYLVRWGGTRKGQGSFYTRPGLVAPTVLRTLAPLCYELPEEPTLDDLRALAHPKPPGVILALKVCDPGMGSASFLVSALRFLAEALLRSLLVHGWLVENDGTFQPGPGLPSGEPDWFRECVRDLPVDLAAAENTLLARLKRLIVERCIYGVDLDPLAVELARLSLWIETMDRDLPFGFLDHKLKCGNSLVGCWFDRFQEYPALALQRPGDDAGDKAHSTGVHHEKGAASSALKAFRDDRLKPALARWIESRDPGVLSFVREGESPGTLHDAALALFEEMHALPVHFTEERAAFYRERILTNYQFLGLRTAFDLWCALWFWPADRLDHLPLPDEFSSPRSESLEVVRQLRDRLRFFHWELEFPDVFTAAGSGFDAILGNPPWEVQKPNSKEFFSNLDPLYRTYGKQEALRRQKEIFSADPQAERDWLDYCAGFKALSNWCAHAAFPWGDPADDWTKLTLARGQANGLLHRAWRERRASRRGFADPAHPFRHQGSADLNTYKLFLEQMHALLRADGRLGVIVPSNVYTDKGSTGLRSLFLDCCRWEWLFGFENREGIFDIHRSFKFCPILLAKGGRTQAIRTAFMRRQLADWENAEALALPYTREQVTQFSPRSRAILELRSPRDAAILEKMYANGVLLGDDSPNGWGLKYAREFDMTNDSKLFPPRPQWEERGFVPDEYGHWLKGGWREIGDCGLTIADSEQWLREPHRRARSVLQRPEGHILSRDGTRAIRVEEIEEVALPLYQGAMIHQFAWGRGVYERGAGQQTQWKQVTPNEQRFEPQFLMAQEIASKRVPECALKIGFRGVSNPTNERTAIFATVPNLPSGNMLPVFYHLGINGLNECTFVAAVNSFANDYQIRRRFAGGTGAVAMSLFAFEETCFVLSSRWAPTAGRLSQRLSMTGSVFATAWWENYEELRRFHLSQLHAVSGAENLRLRCILDAICFEAVHMTQTEASHILADTDHPREVINSDAFTRTLDPKGFWRVDKDKDPELRHTVLSLVAFHDLQRMGLEAFLAQNDGEGWMLPETLRLADYGLGHDDRAREPQPVAARLGPRFYPWQLEGTVEESWEECRRHAKNLRHIRAVGAPPEAPAPVEPAAEQPVRPAQMDLL